MSIAHVDSDPDNHPIIAIAHGLGLVVVAEGVETQEQLAVLKMRGCDESQGYLFSKPIASDGFTRLLGGAPPPQARAA